MAFPINGAHFLANFKMAVDLSGMQLWCPVGLKIPLEVPRAGSIAAAPIGVVGTSSSSLLPSSPTLPTMEAIGDRGPTGVTTAPLKAAKHSPAAREVASVALEVEQLMADYPSVVNAIKKLPKAMHQVKHVIETTCPHLVKAHYRHLDKDKLSDEKAEFLAI